MLSLQEKLKTIQQPPIEKLSSGFSDSVEVFFKDVCLKNMPNAKTLTSWHNLLIKYVNSDNPLLAIRGYNNESKNNYQNLRRGFLTKSNSFSYFYTDNYFAAYFAKMSIDNYIPSFEEFKSLMDSRKFPSRCGPYTENEKQLLAIPEGKNTKINASGYKVAHIINVGKFYKVNNTSLNMSVILEKFFPKGKREDWKINSDKNGDFYLRTLEQKDDTFNKKLATAIFLRFVHPFNYILTPSKKYEENSMSSDISEYSELLKLAHNYFLTNFKKEYHEYLSYIMFDNDDYNILSYNNDLKITYGLDINKDKVKNKPNKQVSNIKESFLISQDELFLMAYEYLINPKTSFRKLEREILHIPSAARGGGFVSKQALNNVGVLAEHKGILSLVDIDMLIKNSEGVLFETLTTLKNLKHK